VVTGRYYDGPKDESGRRVCFVAPSPYTPGPAIARAATLSVQGSPAGQPVTPNGDFVSCLSILRDGGVIQYQYAWWERRTVAVLLWAGGGVLVVGIIWPLLINVLVFHRLTRPFDEPGVDLSRIKSGTAQAPARGNDVDTAKLRKLEAELEASIAGRTGPTLQALPEPPAGSRPVQPFATSSVSEPQTAALAPHESDYRMKPEDWYPTAKGAGFTVAELLVVTAVIGVLTAMLLPVVSTMRERGKQVKCASNLRQVGAGLEMYNQTHKQLPEIATAAALGDSLVGMKAATAQSLHCPSDDGDGFSYAMNAKYAGLFKSAGGPSEMLAFEVAPRHSGKSNRLFFDGHVSLESAD
jgi:prepilin-type processing-associated H-X9-DG protein